MRPFKDLQEFEATTYCTVGDTIVLRKKGSPEIFEIGLITGYYFGTKFICINGAILSFEDLCYEYEFRATDDTWKALGIEDTKPAKFKVGKKYHYFFDENDEGERFITARYKDPIDGRLKVVFSDEVYEIYTDQDGNEYIALYENAINAENAAKYEVNAENEVKE